MSIGGRLRGFGPNSLSGGQWSRGRGYEDPDWQQQRQDFEASPVFERYRNRVLRTDNDLIIVISAASKSAVSGVGKTTLAVELARYFDATDRGFDAEDKATLDAGEFATELLSNPNRIDDRSAIIFDEGQGTLDSSGADARRSMADSVMDVTTALSTMRFRQFTSIIVSQSTDWIDKRVRDIMDLLVLIQPSRQRQNPVAFVYDQYGNDFDNDTTYNERLGAIEWPPLPADDPDYRYLHQLKEESATVGGGDQEEVEATVPDEKQVEIAQELRNEGLTLREIAEKPFIDYSHNWISERTEAPDA